MNFFEDVRVQIGGRCIVKSEKGRIFVRAKRTVMLNTDKKLKLYYSISEVAQMLGVSETLLRFWEKKFPQLNPKRAGRDIRQYRREDVEMAKMIYHLVKERGMTLDGAQRRLRDNGDAARRNYELVDRLKAIREELVSMRDALDAFTYNDVEALKENIDSLKEEGSAFTPPIGN